MGDRRLLAFQGLPCDRAFTPRTTSHQRHSRVPSLCWSERSLSRAAGAPEQAPPGLGLSPNASPEIVEALRQDLEVPRHPSDGGGSVKIVEGPPEVTAGTSGTWTFVFEAGPLGIADGGWLFFQVSPFWNWSTPQVSEAHAPGFTEVSTSAAGLVLESETLDRQLLGVRVSGRSMAAGETIRLTYGAGAGGARVDRFAEAESQFWFAVDGDGDGVRGLLPAPATVDVIAGPAARLILTLPSVARPGEEVELRVAAVDVHGNQAVLPDARLELSWERRDDSPADEPGELPTSIVLAAGPAPSVTRFEAPAGGVLAVRAGNPEGLQGVSNPMLLSPSFDRIFWGDLHGHSNLSDGTGTPEDYYRYARDVAALDVVALTDHDHWGMRLSRPSPELWEEIREQVRRVPRAGALRDAARLRVDELDPRPPPRALLRGRGRGASARSTRLRDPEPALGRAARASRRSPSRTTRPAARSPPTGTSRPTRSSSR